MAREPDDYPDTEGRSLLRQYASDVFDGGYLTIDGHVVFTSPLKKKTPEGLRDECIRDEPHPNFE
jgi:hypothetical protein